MPGLRARKTCWHVQTRAWRIAQHHGTHTSRIQKLERLPRTDAPLLDTESRRLRVIRVRYVIVRTSEKHGNRIELHDAL